MTVTSDERDIDIVIVTGAGASREFGMNYTTLPLMGDWAKALVEKLRMHPPYLAASGLRDDGNILGEEFEAQLGTFLREVEAFKQIRPLLGPSVQFQPLSQGLEALKQDGLLENGWYSQAVTHLDEIVNRIHESLYELFAAKAVDTIRANIAYRELFQRLGVGPIEKFVLATTNYDAIAESAIAEFGRWPDWGQPPQMEPSGESALDVRNLIQGIGRFTPVLHLHGRVGWYRRQGRVFAAGITTHNKQMGIPIVMLPDPEKVYDKDDVINTLWEQFAEALRRAKRVFVLGHSLNDTFLLRALTQNVDPLDRLAITVLADENSPNDVSELATPVVAKVQEVFGHNVDVIPMRFGGGVDGAEAIAGWTDRLMRGGLLSD